VDLLFSENERIQRAALELMQNLASDEIIAQKLSKERMQNLASHKIVAQKLSILSKSKVEIIINIECSEQ
jgi:hypothetical protein